MTAQTFPRTCRLASCDAVRKAPLERDRKGRPISGFWRTPAGGLAASVNDQSLRIDAEFCCARHKRRHFNERTRRWIRIGAAVERSLGEDVDVDHLDDVRLVVVPDSDRPAKAAASEAARALALRRWRR